MTSRATRLAYQARVVGEEPLDGRPCWKLELVAKDDSVAYPRRTTWVDEQTFVPLKQELFALSGMLLKTWTMSDVKEIEGRRFPMRMTIQDMVRKESVTRIEFKELHFGVPLEKETFSLRWLERR